MINCLVIGGGGVLGTAHVGAIRVLADHGILSGIKNFAGSSVGSLFAGALACGADIEFIERELRHIDYKKFQDDSWGYILDIYRLINKYGYCRGDALYDWYGDILKKLTGNPDVTFGEAYERWGNTLIITTTELYENTATTIYCSRHNHANTPIRCAVRKSSGYPFVFAAVQQDGRLYVDGGLLDNYPIGVFDGSDNKTIGLKLMTEETSGISEPIVSLRSFSIGIFEALYNQAQRVHMKESDWSRTVKIPVGNISTMNFNITAEQRDMLYDNGKKAMLDYLKSNVC